MPFGFAGLAVGFYPPFLRKSASRGFKVFITLCTQKNLKDRISADRESRSYLTGMKGIKGIKSEIH
jgi:hypothetical protein